MNLSKRLNEVAGFVTKGNSVADIGTDHGYIPVYLALNGLSPKVIAMDVNEGPLKRAHANILKYHVENTVETRLSDGLDGLVPGEVRTVIIAGMGGLLMIRILSGNMELVRSLDELILSPHSDIRQVRSFLNDVGMDVCDEKIVKDEGKYYFVMKINPSAKPEGVMTEFDLRYGKHLLRKRDTVFYEYLHNELHKKKNILERLNGQAVSGSERIKEISGDIAMIEAGISLYNN